MKTLFTKYLFCAGLLAALPAWADFHCEKQANGESFLYGKLPGTSYISIFENHDTCLAAVKQGKNGFLCKMEMHAKPVYKLFGDSYSNASEIAGLNTEKECRALVDNAKEGLTCAPGTNLFSNSKTSHVAILESPMECNNALTDAKHGLTCTGKSGEVLAGTGVYSRYSNHEECSQNIQLKNPVTKRKRRE